MAKKRTFSPAQLRAQRAFAERNRGRKGPAKAGRAIARAATDAAQLTDPLAFQSLPKRAQTAVRVARLVAPPNLLRPVGTLLLRSALRSSTGASVLTRLQRFFGKR